MLESQHYSDQEIGTLPLCECAWVAKTNTKLKVSNIRSSTDKIPIVNENPQDAKSSNHDHLKTLVGLAHRRYPKHLKVFLTVRGSTSSDQKTKETTTERAGRTEMCRSFTMYSR